MDTQRRDEFGRGGCGVLVMLMTMKVMTVKYIFGDYVCVYVVTVVADAVDTSWLWMR